MMPRQWSSTEISMALSPMMMRPLSNKHAARNTNTCAMPRETPQTFQSYKPDWTGGPSLPTLNHGVYLVN